MTECYACAKLAELMAENNALRGKVGELTAELERETLMACNTCAARIDLQAKVDRLTRENAKLSDDEFYLRCTLVDMNGEVVG